MERMLTSFAAIRQRAERTGQRNWLSISAPIQLAHDSSAYNIAVSATAQPASSCVSQPLRQYSRPSFLILSFCGIPVLEQVDRCIAEMQLESCELSVAWRDCNLKLVNCLLQGTSAT
jgi:hypothetical protein